MSRFATFRAVLCVSTAVMMGVSWPLWVSGGIFPKVPFVEGLRLIPVGASWVRFVICVALMGVAATGFRWRASLSGALALSAWMVLEDQFRLQPWMYQFLLMGFALAACPTGQAVGLCRIFLIALYIHSGLSKLDGVFVMGLGDRFLRTATGLFRVSPAGWPEPVRVGAILMMPGWELLVGVGLCLRQTRRVAAIGAVVQHVALLVILGPLGLAHSLNVLLWNIAIAVEVLLLFRGDAGEAALATTPDARPDRLAPLARVVVILAAILPLGERAGFWDTWPSFALYSAHDERADFLILPDELLGFPPQIAQHFGNVGTFLVLNVNEWSLADRRAPAYPQGRALNGVAEALASRYRGIRPAHLIQAGRASATNGTRSRRELFGLDAIRRHGDTYILNAHPAE